MALSFGETARILYLDPVKLQVQGPSKKMKWSYRAFLCVEKKKKEKGKNNSRKKGKIKSISKRWGPATVIHSDGHVTDERTMMGPSFRRLIWIDGRVCLSGNGITLERSAGGFWSGGLRKGSRGRWRRRSRMMSGWEKVKSSKVRFGGSRSPLGRDEGPSSRTVRLGRVQPQAPTHRTIYYNDHEANLPVRFRVSSVRTDWLWWNSSPCLAIWRFRPQGKGNFWPARSPEFPRDGTFPWFVTELQ